LSIRIRVSVALAVCKRVLPLRCVAPKAIRPCEATEVCRAFASNACPAMQQRAARACLLGESQRRPTIALRAERARKCAQQEKGAEPKRCSTRGFLKIQRQGRVHCQRRMEGNLYSCQRQQTLLRMYVRSGLRLSGREHADAVKRSAVASTETMWQRTWSRTSAAPC
jgi:hypothetical protein